MKRWFLLLFILPCWLFAKPTLVVGSKPFTESYLLAELIAQTIEMVGEANADRKFGLGDTAIVFEGLKGGEIDFYAEYTGTLSNELLKKPSLVSISQIRSALLPLNLLITDSIGFNNTYAISMLEETAEGLGANTIGDLADHPEVIAAFTNAFLERSDGYPLLKRRYGLNFSRVNGITHGLKIQALLSGKIGVTDLYSTDAAFARFPLRTLKDDKKVFPEYFAVFITRKDVAEKFPKTWAALKAFEGAISEKQMSLLNARAEVDKKSFSEVIGVFLGKEGRSSLLSQQLQQWTLEHLILVGVSLFFAILIGIPLGIIARYRKKLGQFVMATTGVIQTVPSLALLCLLIPFFGIGTTPALVAMSLYALLPIVSGTYVGLVSVDPALLEVADTLGLSRSKRLWRVEFPLASRQVLSGIKTSAIINVGTATLAALIGAGGYGQPIVTGLGTYNIPLIFQGAVPAALLAILVHGIFELLERVCVPKGLRLRPETTSNER